jgi:hypothetical protein
MADVVDRQRQGPGRERRKQERLGLLRTHANAAAA